MKFPAVFLDRDGTINRDVQYCSRMEDFELLPGAGEAIRLLNENGLKVVVVTNQSGITRGYFSVENLKSIHKKMLRELAGYDAHVDAIYYCPHHPVDDCACRKPKPYLLLRAAKELDLELRKSFMIGNSLSDIEAGRKAGCTTILINHNVKNYMDTSADYMCGNIFEAIKWILRMVK